MNKQASKEFWHKLDQRMVENQQLASGGLPNKLSPLIGWVARGSWKVLITTSFLITLLGFKLFDSSLVVFVDKVLLR